MSTKSARGKRNLRLTLPSGLHMAVHRRARLAGLSFSEYVRRELGRIDARPPIDRSGEMLVDTSVVIDDATYESVRNLALRMGDSSIRAAIRFVLEQSNASQDDAGKAG